MTEETEQDAFVEEVWRTYLTTGGFTEKTKTNSIPSISQVFLSSTFAALRLCVSLFQQTHG